MPLDDAKLQELAMQYDPFPILQKLMQGGQQTAPGTTPGQTAPPQQQVPPLSASLGGPILPTRPPGV